MIPTDFAITLSLTAGILHIVAFALYNKQMLQGTSEPAFATWMLWSFLTVMNFTSYFFMSGDLVKTFLPVASSLACILTFLFAFTKGKFEIPDRWDLSALGIGIFAGFVWWQYQSAMYANWILQAAIATSFMPTYRKVWRKPTSEKALPWFIWSAAYIFMLGAIFLRWQNQYQDLVYPINCLLLHAIVGLMSRRRISP